MKRLATFILLAIIHTLPVNAQQWVSVATATTGTMSISTPGLVAAGSRNVLWAPLVRRKLVLGSDAFGDYTFTEYDTACNSGTTISLNGKTVLLDAQCDDNGNYYILGKFYDTATFSSGFQVTRMEPGVSPTHFLFRLDKNTLNLGWFRLLGTDENSSAQAFTVKNGGVYVFVDSGFSTNNKLFRYDATTGTSTVVLRQSGDGIVTSVQIDDHDNIYVAGGGVSLSAIDFNGHTITPPPSFSYPAYVARYKAGGVYDWAHLMNDVTIVPRKLTLAGNNSIYYSGPVFDSFSIDGFHVHRPAWVSDYIVSLIDSSGSVQWLRQLKDTIGGDAKLENVYHAVASVDQSLSVATTVRYYIDWGNGIITYNRNQEPATVVNYDVSGAVNWALSVNADYSIPGHIGTDGKNIWLSGNGFDSTGLQFGAVSIPSTYYSYVPFLAKINPALPGPAKTNNIEIPASVAVFPTPAGNYIYLQSTKSGFATILDISGKLVHRQFINGGKTEKIDVAAYPRGIYFIETITEGQRLARKIVLQ